MSARTVIIGDVHGCPVEIDDLLEACAVTSSDQIIFLGDLLDRGPDSARVVDILMSRGYESVLGNHEVRHLDYYGQAKRGRLKTIKNEAHLSTRQQLREAHYAFLLTLPRYIELPEHNVIAVHAGVIPDIPIEQQHIRALCHVQSIVAPTGLYPYWSAETPSYWPSKAPEDARFWTNFYTGPMRIVFGHTVLDKPLMTDLVAGIDLGCVYGGSLAAMILPDWRVVNVPARRQYWKTDRTFEYEVMNGVRCVR